MRQVFGQFLAKLHKVLFAERLCRHGKFQQGFSALHLHVQVSLQGIALGNVAGNAKHADDLALFVVQRAFGDLQQARTIPQCQGVLHLFNTRVGHDVLIYGHDACGFIGRQQVRIVTPQHETGGLMRQALAFRVKQQVQALYVFGKNGFVGMIGDIRQQVQGAQAFLLCLHDGLGLHQLLTLMEQQVKRKRGQPDKAETFNGLNVGKVAKMVKRLTQPIIGSQNPQRCQHGIQQGEPQWRQVRETGERRRFPVHGQAP